MCLLTLGFVFNTVLILKNLYSQVLWKIDTYSTENHEIYSKPKMPFMM